MLLRGRPGTLVHAGLPWQHASQVLVQVRGRALLISPTPECQGRMATQPPVMHLSSDEGPGGFCDLGSDISALIVRDKWSEAQPGR